MPKLPKAPAVQRYANEKSANLFYTNPYNGGTMLTGVKPTITAPAVGSNLSGNVNNYKPVSVNPAVTTKTPASLEQFRREIAAAQQAIADIDKQQYGAMLKGENTDQHDKLRAQHEAALKQLQTAYAQAMGIGFKKPKNQLLPDALSAKDEADFMAGFKKGLGLKDGEEIGQEATVSRLRDMGFAAQDVAAHMPGMDDDYPEPEPDFPKEWPQEEEPGEDSDDVHDIIEEFKEFLKEHEWPPKEYPKEETSLHNQEENHGGKEKANESLISAYRANKAKVESDTELDAVQNHQYFGKYFEGSPSDYEYESYEVYQGVKVVSFTRMEKNEYAGSTYVSNRTAYILIGSRKDILEYADSFELDGIPDGLKALGGAGKIIGEGLKELYPLINNMSIISEVSPLFAAAGMVLDSYQQQGEIIGDELKKYSGEELIIPIGAEFSGGSGSHGGAWYMNTNGVIMGSAR